MIVQIAKPENLPQLAVLFNHYRIFYGQPGDMDGATAFLRERMEKEESVIFVASDESGIVGFTQLYPIFSSVGMQRAWLLNDLFVADHARGSGAADALLKAAQQWGADTSSRWLMLQTARDNFRAQKVYERNGWEKDEHYFVYNFRYQG